tara:strand:+ start:54 stop:1007 length:954 start_codon:yes stop_codon:yes gene_type:complete
MRITRSRIKKIVKEELNLYLEEITGTSATPSSSLARFYEIMTGADRHPPKDSLLGTEEAQGRIYRCAADPNLCHAIDNAASDALGELKRNLTGARHQRFQPLFRALTLIADNAKITPNLVKQLVSGFQTLQQEKPHRLHALQEGAIPGLGFTSKEIIDAAMKVRDSSWGETRMLTPTDFVQAVDDAAANGEFGMDVPSSEEISAAWREIQMFHQHLVAEGYDEEEFATAAGKQQDIRSREERGEFEKGDWGIHGDTGYTNKGGLAGEYSGYGDYPWVAQALEDLQGEDYDSKITAVSALVDELGISINDLGTGEEPI